MTVALDVAKFMVEQLKEQAYLYQQAIAYQIDERFGEGFTSINANGNASINADVLAEFNKLTPDVVWVRRDRMWRRREDYDRLGRQQ
jgi:hypothetical protein